MNSPQINYKIKKIALLVIFGVLLMTSSTAVARADGILTPQEERFGDNVSGSLCRYIDNVGINRASMTEAMRIIYVNTPGHMDMSDAVDIINYVVQSYCPEHWDNLVAFGEGVRA